MKRIVAIILSLTLIIAGLNLVTPVLALQSGDYTYEIINVTEAQITGYVGNTGVDFTLTIPDTLGGLPVTSIGFAAFQNITTITGVTFLTTALLDIGDAAFSGCTGLTGITIPSTVTQIGLGSFQGCTALTTVNIGSDVVSIGDGAFQNSTSLTTITVDPANIAYEAAGDVLFTIGQVVLVQYPLGDAATTYSTPSTVTDIGPFAFSGASNIVSVDFTASTIMYIGTEAFSNCTALSNIDIPDSVTTIGDYVFAYDTSLGSASIGNGLTTTGAGLFSGCSALTSVTFGTSLQTIGYGAFEGCVLLNNVVLPNTVTTIEDFAFAFCTDLSSFSMSSGIQVIGNYAFYSCTALTGITLANGLLTIGASAFENCYSLTTIAIPNSTTTIGDFAFNYNTSLATVSIGTGLASIGLRVFDNCTSLSGITVAVANPNFMSSAEGILFNETQTVLYRYPNTRAGAYEIPTGVVEITDSAFSNVPGLTNIYFPNSLSIINNYAFYNNPSLTSILIFGSGLTVIGDYAFEGSAGINTLYFAGETTGSAAPLLQTGVFSASPIQVYYAGGATGYTDPWFGMSALSTITVSPTTPVVGTAYVTNTYPSTATNPEYRISVGAVDGPWTAYTAPIPLTKNSVVASRFTDTFGNTVPLGALSVTNIQVVLVSIAVTTPPTTTVYNDGNTFDPTGMVVTGTYSDDTTAVIPLTGYTFTPLLTLGQTSITITSTSGGFTATTPVTVNARAITSIAIKTLPTKLKYMIGRVMFNVGETLDLAGGVLTVNYTAGLPADIPMTDLNMIATGYNIDLQTTGITTQTITITYSDFVPGVTFNVTVLRLGDVNNNGTVTSVDALMILKHSSGVTLLTADQQMTADLNRSAGISSVDALIVLKFASGVITFY